MNLLRHWKSRYAVAGVLLALAGCHDNDVSAPISDQTSFHVESLPARAGFAVLLCHPDDQNIGHPYDYYDKLFTTKGIGTGNVIDYWRDQSYGHFDLSDNQIFGPINTGVHYRDLIAPSECATDAGFDGNCVRHKKVQTCVDAAAANGVKFDKFINAIVVYNVHVDEGSIRNVSLPLSDGSTRIVKAPIVDVFSPLTGLLHEMGHALGLDHSFSTKATSCDIKDDSRPGAYCDTWDIMSANLVFWYHGANALPTCAPLASGPSDPCKDGPGLDAYNRLSFGWLPTNETGDAPTNGIVTIAALNHPEVAGVRYWRVPINSANYYSLEFLRADGWYRAIPNDAVLVHVVNPTASPASELDTLAIGGPALGNGGQFDDGKITMTVTNIDTVAQTATVKLSTCRPTTCAAQGATCGSVPDGCGGTLSCGTCTAPATCGGNHVANACGVCVPTTCAVQGAACGSIPDSCGGVIDCGSCGIGSICSGNQCAPLQCGGLFCGPSDCGFISDGCGGVICCSPPGMGDQCGCSTSF